MYPDAKRAVVHMDLDTFFVSAERKRDQRLEGKALIIGGKSNRGVVASCSYEARTYGVHSAMPMRMARRLCPHAIVMKGDMELYSRESGLVTEVVRDTVPLFEKSSIDEFYIDASGMERFFGTWQWAKEVRKRVIHETGLPISLGLAINKMVAKVATNEAKPSGQLQVEPGHEENFLAPLPVSKIPMVGKKTTEFLRNMGIRKVSALREIPREMLERILGKQGIMLWKRARGIDDSPVIPYSERKSISSERTFRQDTIDLVMLKATIARMSEKLAFQLRKEQKLCATLTVKIRYANFDTITRQMRIPYTSCDHILSKKALELFHKLYDRRLRIRLVGVRLSNLIHGNPQLDLFDDTQAQVRLYEAIDKMKHKYGAEAVLRGNAVY